MLSFVFFLIGIGQNWEAGGMKGDYKATLLALSSLLRTTVPLCCTSIAARHSSLSHPSCTVVPLCSVKSYPEKGDDNQLCPWERWPEKLCSFGWKKGYFDLNENLFQNIPISAQYYLWKRGSNYPVFICWHWMIFIFHLFWFKNKSTVYNVYTSHIALKVNLKSSLNSLKLAIAIKTVFTSWEHWESLKLHGFLLQNWEKKKKKKRICQILMKKIQYFHTVVLSMGWHDGRRKPEFTSLIYTVWRFGCLLLKIKNFIFLSGLLSFCPIHIVSFFYKVNRTDLFGFA